MDERLRRRLMSAAVSMMVVTCVLTSCSDQTSVMTLDGTAVLDWRGAKTETLEKQNEIVATIDPALVDSISARDTGSLLSCEGERMYTWASSTEVTLIDPSTAEPVIAELARTWNGRDGHTARTRTDFSGDPAVRIEPPYGGSYLVGIMRDGERVDLLSFSRCFELPEGEWPGGSF